MVLVGIDEATVAQFPAPMALWHPQLAALLEAMVLGEATALGLDMILPDRSYDFLVDGNDRRLMSAMLQTRGKVAVVFGRTIEGGRLRDIYPPFLSLLGEESFGLVLQPRDSDGVVRRFGHGNAAELGLQTLAGQLSRRLGIEPQDGLIDYSIGMPIDYVPLQQVVAWVEQGDEVALRDTFSGHPVFLGGVLRFVDRHFQPASVAAWEDDPYAPGVLTHVQALRNLLGPGLIQPLPIPWQIVLYLIAALFVLLGPKRLIGPIALMIWAALLVVGSSGLLYHGLYLGVAGPVCAALLAWLLGYLYDSAMLLQERGRLRNAFGGYVSPQIMDEILAGEITSELRGRRLRICILFADVRGFTTLTEALGAEQILELLNGYFERVTPQIHDHDGTLDKYIGDGIMAFFGAPKPMADPTLAAFDAAKAMLSALEDYNKSLVERDLPSLGIGIGLEVGEVVVGHIGSSARYEYTAIGDAVNVASRVEGLTRDTGYAVMMTAHVAKDLPDVTLTPLGTLPIKGHTPVEVFGWGKLEKQE